LIGCLSHRTCDAIDKPEVLDWRFPYEITVNGVYPDNAGGGGDDE
jgi:hypothetical protein